MSNPLVPENFLEIHNRNAQAAKTVSLKLTENFLEKIDTRGGYKAQSRAIPMRYKDVILKFGEGSYEYEEFGTCEADSPLLFETKKQKRYMYKKFPNHAETLRNTFKDAQKNGDSEGFNKGVILFIVSFSMRNFTEELVTEHHIVFVVKLPNICWTCRKKETPQNILRVCGGCRERFYCSTKCQRYDWKEHKKACSTSSR